MEKFFNTSFCVIPPNRIKQTLSSATGKNIKIAVIDSGWDIKKRDCRIKKGIGLVNPNDELELKESENYNDENGHGTACAEIILRLAPDIEIYPVKIFGKQIETSINILQRALFWAIENKMNLIHLSLGTVLEEALKPIYYACEVAKKNRISIISSQANNTNYSYPAVFENVISVVSGQFETGFDFEVEGKNYNEYKAKGIYDDTLTLSENRIKMAGNSFAAPNITAISALVLEKYGIIEIDKLRNILDQLAINSHSSNITGFPTEGSR